MRMSNTVPIQNQAVTKQPLLIAPNHHHHLSPDADGDGDSYINMSTTNKYKYVNNSLALLASASSPCNLKMKNFKYMECLKNHAAAIGGSATDGCGEFMPGGEEGSLEALKCEACNCHRNFHRKKIIHHYQPQPQPQQLLMGMGMRMKSISTSGEGRKRPRSKFSQEQKEKMQRFAEKAEWKIHKADDAELRSFCEEIGVNAKVLKVWMHNNKYNHHIPTNPNLN